MSKCISVLGSTGSIGRQTLQVAEELGLRVAALTAGRQIDLLEQQARQFRPCLAAVYEEAAARELRERLKDLPIQVMSGMEGLLAAAELAESDTVVTAVMGSVGLEPTLAAIRKKKRIALANKETLVAAGHLVMESARQHGVQILPVDSEHSAIFQSLRGGRKEEVRRLILTASGGPFRGYTREQLHHVTREQCLHHPNWNMGPKVTVDSATLANKGLEVMEAHWLFDMPYEAIDVVIHPQSLVHSLVEFCDGSVMAQMGLTDMRLPIQYAFSWPARYDCAFGHLDLVRAGTLTFEAPDLDAFPALRLAIEAGKAGGTAPCVFNACNEVCVQAFLAGRIAYTDIAPTIATILDAHKPISHPSLEEIAAADQSTRIDTEQVLQKI